jgi:MFS family permease
MRSGKNGYRKPEIRRIGMSSCWVELWAVCSASASALLALNWVAVSESNAAGIPFGLTKVSDRYGRKNVLIATMMGNILSAIIWLRSTSFVSWLSQKDYELIRRLLSCCPA